MDIQAIQRRVKQALSKKGLSAAAASRMAIGNPSLIKNIMKGHSPRLDSLMRLAEVLEVELYFGPPRAENLNQLPIDSETGGGSTPGSLSQNLYVGRFNTDSAPGLARFTAVDLPVLGWAKCSLSGHILTGEETYPDLPMPEAIEALDDDEVFYAIAKGLSMRPEGIEDGDYCLISPATPVALGLRVWFKDQQKRATIKRLVGESETEYALRGWVEPDPRGRQRHYQDRWMKSNIAAQGVVLAVYRGKPDLNKPTELIPDPKPPPMPAPPAIAKTLGLEAGATVADVIRAIEAKAELGVDAVQEKLREAAQAVDELKAEAEAATRQVVSQAEEAEHTVRLRTARAQADVGALAVYGAEDSEESSSHRQVPLLDIEVAAGGGAFNAEESHTERGLWFERGWLDRTCVDATQCALVKVRGESMEPTLRPGCKILVDVNRRRRLEGHIYVMRTRDEGVVVKRLRHNADDGWLLVSDNPSWPDVPWPDDAEVIGEVKWMAATLP